MSMLKFLNIGLIIIITMLMVTLLYSSLFNKAKEKKKFSLENIDKKMKKNKYFYETINLKIRRLGLNEMLDKYKFFQSHEVTPTDYYFIKIVLALIFFLIGISESIGFAILVSFFGYFMIDIIMKNKNKSDNSKIIKELNKIYNTISILSSAGVYITSILTECYLKTKNKRLKKALLKLVNSINTSDNFDKAVDDFTTKFKSEQIDAFGIVIKQSLENGNTSQIAEDLSDQISSIKKALNIKKKKDLDNKKGIYMFLVFSVVVAIFTYCTLYDLNSSLHQF